ncbi:hypothetical protein GLA29479_1503 [Lysobacter antibioticus]|nr:hypothetical protein GLA29479_1503 [Lysobacter antibioticus]
MLRDWPRNSLIRRGKRHGRRIRRGSMSRQNQRRDAPDGAGSLAAPT